MEIEGLQVINGYLCCPKTVVYRSSEQQGRLLAYITADYSSRDILHRGPALLWQGIYSSAHLRNMTVIYLEIMYMCSVSS
jgi:hypothetical protein